MRIRVSLVVAFAIGWIVAGTSGADMQAGIEAIGRQDYERARAELEPHAEQGNMVAQYNLGVMYRNGYGVPKDPERAMEWFLKASAQGSDQAAFAIGLLYAQADEPDPVEAYVWFRIASKRGHKEARKNLYHVTRMMTPEQVVQARKEADERTASE